MSKYTQKIEQGFQLQQQGQLYAAEKMYRQILKKSPNHAQTLHLLGVLQLLLGDANKAISYLKIALKQYPKSTDIHNNLAIAYQYNQQMELALSHCQKSIELAPNHAQNWSHLGNILKTQNQWREAEKAYRRAIELQPQTPELYNNLGLILQDQGFLEAAIPCFQRVLQWDPQAVDTFSNLLHCLRAIPVISDEEMYQYIRIWGDMYGTPAETISFPNDPTPNRRLKVGYISAEFRKHPTANTFKMLFQNHNPEVVEIYAYFNGVLPDQHTRQFQNWAHHWRPIVGMSNPAVADLIRKDQIDILVDLSGHTAYNRLLTFELKPAPIQVTGPGYICSTGLATMDYLIADQTIIPQKHEIWCKEKVVRVRSALRWQPNSEFADMDPGPAPVQQNGWITFGSGNSLFKLNQEVIATWANILQQLPTARLMVKAAPFSDPSLQAQYQKLWQSLGIPLERLVLKGQTSQREHLEFWQQVDIALEPFPYQGGITTCEALWMGVPAIVLNKGTRTASSILQNVGLADLVVGSIAKYIAKAVEMATNNIPSRQQLRQNLLLSPICDGKGYACEIEAAYRQMWQKWCCWGE